MLNNRFIKRTLALAMAGVCIISSFSTVTFAEKSQDNTEKTVSEVAQATGDNSFKDYISGNSFKAADETIVLKAEESGLEVSETNGKKSVALEEKGKSAEFSFEVKEDGLFNLSAEYLPLNGVEKNIIISVLVDGKAPYDELMVVELPRLWTNANEIKANQLGNEYQPTQIEKELWTNQYFYDTNGFYEDPFSVNLSKGMHTLTVTAVDGSLALASFTLKGAKEIPSYEDVKKDYSEKGYKNYSGKEITLEGEKADYKTQKSIALKSDSTEPCLSPVDPYVTKINYIGGDGWSQSGETVFWEMDVPKSGLYKIGLRYLQSYTLNGYSYRRLTVEGEVPFKEAAALPFKYNDNWVYKYLGSDDESYLFYLEEGTHTLALAVTMGPLSDVNRRLQDVVAELGRDYIDIVKITGETPDVNRDYDLFGQISGLTESFERLSKELEELISEMQKITGTKGGSDIVVLQNMLSVLVEMLEHPFQAQDYKDSYYSNYCSIGSILYSMRELALALDCMQVGNPEIDFSEEKSSFWGDFSFSLKRFFHSFVADYGSVSKSDSKDALTIWLYWGRDQTQIFEKLVQESFIPEYDIPVNIKIVSSSLVLALLAENSPDLSLRVGGSEVINLALRGALYDLKQFDDFGEITTERFTKTATEPYKFLDGCYGLPDTQDFGVMFYRTDVLKEYGLTPPKTWNEFYNCVSVLSRNNMQIGLPVPSNESAGIYTTLLLQNNGTLYTEDRKATNLASEESIKAFELATRLYLDYGLPVSYDFYNRFRSGEMPLGIANYSMCTQLSVTAPEINGKWAIAEMPGVETENGINNVTASGGVGNVILKNSKNKENAWTFLKWWTSAETQANFSNEVESVLGEVARVTSANKEALMLMPWKEEHLSVIMKQRENIVDFPEVPGGYYVSRSMGMAFWDVYNKHEDVKDTLVSWGNIADREIERKLRDYDLFD